METDGFFYFNRCRRCSSLITKLQLLDRMKRGEVCECGSTMFSPTNPIKGEWCSFPVLKMVLYQLLGKITPAPEPAMMPHVASNMEYPRVLPLSMEEIRPPEEGE